jgi:hypothetical protein
MNRTALRSFAILSLWSCVSTPPPVAAPAFAQAARPKPDRPPLAIDITDLFQHWVHSTEEERSGGTVRIFRPAASMEFPPSRFRMAYKFARNGGCEFYVLSPDDAHYFKACTWRISANDKTLLQIIADGLTTSYRIVELTGTILRLTPLEEPPREQVDNGAHLGGRAGDGEGCDVSSLRRGDRGSDLPVLWRRTLDRCGSTGQRTFREWWRSDFERSAVESRS